MRCPPISLTVYVGLALQTIHASNLLGYMRMHGTTLAAYKFLLRRLANPSC
jgi:hypothetical protein